MAAINDLLKQNIEFRITVDNVPVSRGEIEVQSVGPKAVIKNGSPNRVWTIELLSDPNEHSSKPLLCHLRCDGYLVGDNNGYVSAFPSGEPCDTKWLLHPGQDVDGKTKLNIVLSGSSVSWIDTAAGEQIPLASTVVPEYKFNFEPLFK